MIQDDLAIVIAREDHTSPGWQTKLACDLQMMDEASVSKFSWNDPRRQAYRRVIRWAKETPTQQVETAIRLNDDNKTIPEMMREAASHIRRQIDASKAKDPLTIALKELEEARARIKRLEEARARIKRLEEALVIGVGDSHAKTLIRLYVDNQQQEP